MKKIFGIVCIIILMVINVSCKTPSIQGKPDINYSDLPLPTTIVPLSTPGTAMSPLPPPTETPTHPPLDMSTGATMTKIQSPIYTIPLSKEFIIENGNELDDTWIKLSFPESWLKNPPDSFKGAIILKFSAVYLAGADNNQSPDIVEASFPHLYFEGLPEVERPVFPPRTNEINPTDNVNESGNGTRDIELSERLFYYKSYGTSITGARGAVYPYEYYSDGEDFLTYHEIEFYGYQDCIEIVCGMDDTWNGEAHVFFAVYTNGGSTPQYSPAVTADIPGGPVYYQFYISSNYYICTINNDDYWADDLYPSNDFDIIYLSSELDTKGGIGQSFSVETRPINITDLRTGTWQGTSYVNQALDYYGMSQSEDYVGLAGQLDSSGLAGRMWAEY